MLQFHFQSIAFIVQAKIGHFAAGNVKILGSLMEERGTLSRFWWEQREIPKLIRAEGADVLLSTGNFAIRNSPVPQILLSRNSLYTSNEFSRDLRRRGEYRMWADTRLKGFLARQSILRAQLTVAPSEAFARELARGKSMPLDQAIKLAIQKPVPQVQQGASAIASG